LYAGQVPLVQTSPLGITTLSIQTVNSLRCKFISEEAENCSPTPSAASGIMHIPESVVPAGPGARM